MDFRLTTPTLDQNCWPAAPQTLINEYSDKVRGQLEDLTGIIASETEPDPEDRDKLWVKLDGSGRPVGHYFYGSGAWVWPVDDDINKYTEGERMPWLGDPSDIPLIWGGEAGVATLTTGPFWVIDTAFAGRSPMGVGSIPDANPAKALSSGEEYGEGSHLMTDQEVAAHTHPLQADSSITNADGTIDVVNSGVGANGLMMGNTGPAEQSLSVEQNEYTADQETMPVIHPVLGVYFLKRTIRKYLRGA